MILWACPWKSLGYVQVNGETNPKCGQHSSTAWDPRLKKTEKERKQSPAFPALYFLTQTQCEQRPRVPAAITILPWWTAPPNFGTKQSFPSTDCFCHVFVTEIWKVTCHSLQYFMYERIPKSRTLLSHCSNPNQSIPATLQPSVSSYDICSETTTSLTLTLDRFLSYTACACLNCALFSFT